MAIYVAAVHLSDGVDHEHITEVIWISDTTMRSGKTSTAGIVKFINDGQAVLASNGKSHLAVGVVKGDPPYIQCYIRKEWVDLLLTLPRY
jgi:hypothetical protein